MTLDECMDKATAAIDELIDDAMAEGLRLLADRGATDEEIESYREWYGQQLADSRASNLANVRAWLEREGETLQ